MLAILDGFGCSKTVVTPLDLASMPFIETFKQVSAYDAGCFWFSGWSSAKSGWKLEAGHMNIGAGRVVDSDSVIISKTIEDGSFLKILFCWLQRKT